MTSLIQTLKEEHNMIRELLDKTYKAGISSQEGQLTFKEAKSVLIGHLKKEDAQLYPVLQKLQEEKEIVNSFSEEMKGISKVVLEFFRKYERGGQGSEFAIDFGKILGALKRRITKEELILYPKYEKYAK